MRACACARDDEQEDVSFCRMFCRRRRRLASPVRLPNIHLAQKNETRATHSGVLFALEAIIQRSAPPRGRGAQPTVGPFSAFLWVFFGNHVVAFIAFFPPPLLLSTLSSLLQPPRRSCCVELLLNCRSGKSCQENFGGAAVPHLGAIFFFE